MNSASASLSTYCSADMLQHSVSFNTSLFNKALKKNLNNKTNPATKNYFPNLEKKILSFCWRSEICCEANTQRWGTESQLLPPVGFCPPLSFEECRCLGIAGRSSRSKVQWACCLLYWQLSHLTLIPESYITNFTFTQLSGQEAFMVTLLSQLSVRKDHLST